MIATAETHKKEICLAQTGLSLVQVGRNTFIGIVVAQNTTLLLEYTKIWAKCKTRRDIIIKTACFDFVMTAWLYIPEECVHGISMEKEIESFRHSCSSQFLCENTRLRKMIISGCHSLPKCRGFSSGWCNLQCLVSWLLARVSSQHQAILAGHSSTWVHSTVKFTLNSSEERDSVFFLILDR